MGRILFLVTSGGIGGAQHHVLLAAQKLKKEGTEVIVGTGDRGFLTEELEKKGILTIIFTDLKRSFNLFLFFSFCWHLRKFVEKEKVDMINLNSFNTLWTPFGLLGLKNKPKIIFTVHGMGYISPGFKKSIVIKAFVWVCVKVALFFIDEIIFVCNYDKNLAEKMGLIKEGQGRVVYNEVEKIDFLGKEEAIKELRKTKEFPEDKIIIGTITRLEYAKNNEMLINAFNKLKSDKSICLIIGDGPEISNLKSQISNLKLENKVFLLGDIPEAAKYLKAFDIFTITSRYEGMPYALLEAMSAEVKIIATRVGGIPEILEGKGILIESDNVEELVNNLNRLLS